MNLRRQSVVSAERSRQAARPAVIGDPQKSVDLRSRVPRADGHTMTFADLVSNTRSVGARQAAQLAPSSSLLGGELRAGTDNQRTKGQADG